MNNNTTTTSHEGPCHVMICGFTTSTDCVAATEAYNAIGFEEKIIETACDCGGTYWFGEDNGQVVHPCEFCGYEG